MRESGVCFLRRIQTAETCAYTMTDDWASQFRPGALPVEEPEPEEAKVEVDNDKLILALEAINTLQTTVGDDCFGLRI